MPKTPRGLKQLAQRLRDEGKFDDARAALRAAAELAPTDPQPWMMLGYIDMAQGEHAAARGHFEQALALEPEDADANQGMATIFYLSYENESGLRYIDRTLEKRPDHPIALICKVQILTRLFRMEEASALCSKLIETESDREKKATHWNDLGNIHRAMGQLEQGEIAYRKAASLTDTDPAPLSNWLTLLHYMPDRSPLDILQACKEWARKFAPTVPLPRPVPADRSPDRKLRIGMFSDGFRQHPVGAMTTSALEHLVKLGFELYIYTTNSRVDEITQRVMAIATRWASIANVRDEELARRVREDGIDVLVDLAGHNSGNRIRTMTLQPAPILMKWVGGLINTTGVEAIDYLLTDNIESPPGSDSFYTEKLVRMPDDYICYVPPSDAPDVAPLPALRNGYITFGCFNNPAKVNEVVLAKWAGLLNAVPTSRLYLKGGAYGSVEMQQRILGILAAHGIDADRVRLEGQSVHAAHMACYNEVDIALDPWPYSGGLTTCEAMMMGVPVVTLPGPTFAGRHSATHLINAGMPELVVADWEQYHARVLELAGDLQSLSTIRRHLRDTLLRSPVCDGRRFAGNLAQALRAIWQRYCEDKPPAALSFTPEGQPWFQGDASPTVVSQPPADPDAQSFEFSFQGKVVTLDHGANLLRSSAFTSLAGLRGLQLVQIDPASQAADGESLKQRGLLHDYHAHVALGDGKPATLYACLNASASGTLEPLPSDREPAILRPGLTVLTRLPIATVALDSIEGLDYIDWLVLGGAYDSVAILDGGQRLLQSALVVQVAVNFVAAYRDQPDLSSLSARLNAAGLVLLRFDDARYASALPADRTRPHTGSQLTVAQGVFIPGDQKLRSLPANALWKLAFILHSAYGATDAAYRVLCHIDPQVGERFLANCGWLKTADTASQETRSAGDARRAATVLSAAEYLARPAPYAKVCVGVPVYNEARHIEATIRSLQAQQVEDVRFLISDNGSTDGTLDIIRDVVGNDERFSIVRQESNIGAIGNFRWALAHSSSKYFMWLGAHDCLSDGYLASVLTRIEQADDVSMVCGMPHSIIGTTVAAVPSAVYDFSDPSALHRYMSSVALLANCTILHSLFRREQLEGFDIRETISWDHVVISRLLWGGKLAFDDKAQYYRRYFPTRAEGREERLSAGKARQFPRKDFYDYYVEDFSRLATTALSASEVKKHAKAIRDVLKKRFEKVPE
ncbi:hypothetical protein AKI39_10420 [Bordetella sp. H567]|nr:hypothetical protein AKI39_10420 [Bordetella sp. H567]